MKLPLPEFIGRRYRVLDTLGKGGMGIVYLVHDILMNNAVFALKTIRQDLVISHKKTGIDNFKNEYEIMTRLKHPNLTQVHDFGEDEDFHYIVMEYLEGILLSDFIKQGRCQTMEASAGIIVQVLRALGYIHSRNIIYRDLKPNNIMIIGKRVKIMDFGLSNLMTKKEDAIKGTVMYLSPDAVNGDINFSMDFFTLGLVWYQMLTGRVFLLKSRSSVNSVITLLKNRRQYETYQEEMLSLIHNTVLRGIISRMTAYDKDSRYRTGQEIIRDINSFPGMEFEFETADTRATYILGNAFADRRTDMLCLKTGGKGEEKPDFIIYSGASGAGKTRLFMEYKKYCRLNSMPFYDACCTVSGHAEYRPIKDIAEQMIPFASRSLLDRSGRYLRLILPEHDRLKNCTPPKISDSHEGLREIIVFNLSSFLVDFACESGKCINLYFDDLQYIDNGSLDILISVLQRLDLRREESKSIRMLAGINEEEISSPVKFSSLFEKGNVQVYYLAPFDIHGVEEFMENVFGHSFISNGLKGAIPVIAGKVGGNPLFLKEYLRALIDKKIIRKGIRYWELAEDIKTVDIPSGLSELVEKRVESLLEDENTKTVIQILSLIKAGLSLDDIKAVSVAMFGFEDTGILLNLERMEIIQSSIREDRIYYTFSGSIMRDAVIKTIKEEMKLRLQLARTLDSAFGLETERFLDDTAYNYLKGGDTQKAVLFYERCEENARKNYMLDNALHYEDILLGLINDEDSEAVLNVMLNKARSLEIIQKWDKALDLLSCILERADRHSLLEISGKACALLGRIQLGKGDSVSARASFYRCLSISGEINDDEMLSEALNSLLLFFYEQSLFDEGISLFNEYRQFWLERNDIKWYSQAVNIMGNIHYARSEYDRALEYFETFRKMQSDDKKSRASSSMNLGNVHMSRGDNEKALECYEEARALYEEIGAKKSMGKVLFNVANIIKTQGDYKKALKHYEYYRSISSETGSKAGYANAVFQIGLLYQSMADYPEAVENYKQAEKIFRDLNNKKGIGAVMGNLGTISFFRGNYDEAMGFYQTLKGISEELGNMSGVSVAIGNIGLIYKNRGDYGKALECFEEKRRISEETGNKRSLGIAYSNMGEVYDCLGRYERAMEYYKKDLAISRELKDRAGAALTLNNLGVACQHMGRLDKALENFKAYLSVSKELGDKLGIGVSTANIGNIWYDIGDTERALKNYNKSIKILSLAGIKDRVLVSALLRKSEILMEDNKNQEAQTACGLALQVSEELQDHDAFFEAGLLKCRIDNSNDKQALLSELKAMISSIQKDSWKAAVYYEMYMAGRNPGHRNQALKLYQDLYEKNPTADFKKKISDLKSCP